MADVDFAIGIRRTVVKNKLGRTVPFLQAFFINLVVLPEFQKVRFPFRQVAAHGEIGLRQM